MNLAEDPSTLAHLRNIAARRTSPARQEKPTPAQADAPAVEEDLPPEIRLVPFQGIGGNETGAELDLTARLYREGYQIDPNVTPDWKPRPSVVNQFYDPRFAGTWKEGPVMKVVHDLSEEDQCAAHNALMARTEPPGAPEVLLEAEPRIEFADGRYIALVIYREMSYLPLERRSTAVNQNPLTPRLTTATESDSSTQNSDAEGSQPA